MEKHFIHTQSLVLLTFIVFVTSCSRQVKTELPKDSVSEQNSITTGMLKIPKPGGLNNMATIGCGIADKVGNIWFGSNGEGVYRFDGKSFTNFTEDDGLDNNIVYSILEDNAGNIWVGSKTGLNRYNKSANKSTGKTFTQIPGLIANASANERSNSFNDNPPGNNGVWCMMQDKSGTIWFGTDNGVYCYDGLFFTRFLDNNDVINEDSLQLKSIFSILEDKNGSIWFTACVSEGVSCFDGKFLRNIIPYNNIGRTDCVIEDKNGNLWFCAVFYGLCRYDGKTFTKNIFKEKTNFGPTDVLEDNSGNIWFNTQKGLGCYDGNNLKILTGKDGITGNNTRPVLMDKSGNLWFSSAGMGLYKYDGKTFSSFSEEKNESKPAR
jgi:ligand-binding sensor domain-containing protein